MLNRGNYIISGQPSPLETGPWPVSRLPVQETSLALTAFSLIVVLVYMIQCQQRKQHADLAKTGAVTILRHKLLTSGSPCTQCHYLTQNEYLPCAVNPHIVATSDAVNCADFRKEKSDFSSPFYLAAINRKHQLSSLEETSRRPNLTRPTVAARYQVNWPDEVNEH